MSEPHQIVLTGGSGFIGQALSRHLIDHGHRVIILSRNPDQYRAKMDPGIRWIRDLDELGDETTIHAIVNLAGQPLDRKRWTRDYKQQLIDSRVRATRDVHALIQRLDHKPAVLISGSAIGYYGHQGAMVLNEYAAPSLGFSHEMCRKWEREAQRADVYCRVCLLRIGVVLDRDGGLLERLRWPFSLGLGGRLGDGQQWLSWIHRQDLVRMILHLVCRGGLAGPFNATAPEPVTNRIFTRTLARAMKRPAVLPMPAVIARLAFGEMADELMLKGQRVVPEQILKSGFEFLYPDLASALADIHGNRIRPSGEQPGSLPGQRDTGHKGKGS